MNRKELYSTLESLDGGEALRDAVKNLLTEADSRAETVENKYKELNGNNTSLMAQLEEFKAKAGGAEVMATENNVLSKQMETMAQQLEQLTNRAKEADEFEQKVATEKKNAELSSFFTNAVNDSFGAKNTAMSVGYAMSQGDIAYGEDGSMTYKGKAGDEGLELFKADNSHLITTTGAGTTGGAKPATPSSLEGMSVEQLLQNPSLLK